MSRAGGPIPAKGLAKASLALAGSTLPVGGLKFKYNPEQFSLDKQVDWKNPGIRLHRDWLEPEYLSTAPAVLSLEVFFDAFDELLGDVSRDVAVLLDWTKPGPGNAPPKLEFRWGSSNVLTGMQFYLSSLNATYTLFRFDGTPIRATCRLTLIEATNPAARTNPTSGGVPGMETHVLVAGESLQSVAWSRYRDATLWRAIAVFNGIDDPMRVPAGTSLVIPPRRDAAALSS